MPRFKFPLGIKIFVALWLVVLLVPPLREPVLANRVLDGYIVGRYTEPKDLARRFPDDPKVLALVVENRHVANPPYRNEKDLLERRMAEYDALLKRFPREHWLRAERLMFLARHIINMDYEGAPKRNIKRHVDAPSLRKALAVTLEGEKLDPGNAFFPRMEAAFRFGLGENDQGVGALQKAANCDRFVDYVQERCNQKIEVHSRDHALLFEEKLDFYSGILFPHYSQMVNAQKAALQLALNARKKGDDRRALEVTHAIIGAASVYRRNTDTVLGILNAAGMVRMTLNEINKAFGLKGEKPGHSILERQEQVTMLAKELGGIAQRYGRGDIAKRALTEAQVQRPALNLWEGNWWDGFGLEGSWSRVGFQGNKFAAQMAYWSFIFGSLWLFGRTLLLWLSRRDEIAEKTGILARGQVTSCTSFTFCATLGFCALAAYFGVGFIFEGVGWVQSLDLATNEMINAALIGALPYSVFVFWLFSIPFFMWRRNWVWERLPKLAPPTPLPVPSRVELIRRGLWLLTLCVTGITATNGYSLWDGTLLQPLVSPVLAWSCGLAILCFEIYRALRFQTFALNRLTMGRLHRERQSHTWLFATRLLVSTAGVLSVTWSFIYLLGALSLWPLRSTMNRTLEHRLAIGEVKWLQEEKARKSLRSNQ